MKLNLVTKNTAPPPPYPDELTSFPIAVVPFALGALRLRSEKYWWIDSDSWHNGRSLCYELSVGLLMPIGRDLLNMQAATYNMLDAALFNVERTVTGDGTFDDPFVYTPPIDQVHAADDGLLLSLLDTSTDSHDALVNYTQGTAIGAYTDVRDPNDQFDAIVAAIEATGGSDADMLSALLEIITLLGV